MTVRVFATKWFARYARKHGLSDKDLCRAVTRAEKGSIDAELGGNLTQAARSTWRKGTLKRLSHSYRPSPG